MRWIHILAVPALASVALATGGCGASTYHLRGPSTGFYYGEAPPVDQLAALDQVVLEPLTAPAPRLKELHSRGSRALAYLSVGEVARTRPWFSEIKPAWIIGENNAWNSVILDQGNPEVREFLLGLAQRFWKQGFRGFFLDTTDSHLLALGKKPRERQIWEAGLVKFIKALGKRFGGGRILVNRGFEVLPRVAKVIHGVVAESLYAAWDQESKRFAHVPAPARRWLRTQLRLARRLGLPVTVIDYLPAEQRHKARATARRIADEGFVPWIASPLHDTVGLGLVEPFPRRVLVLYDGSETPVEEGDFHQKLGVVLDHLGLLPHHLDVRGPLPSLAVRLHHRYAGIFLWVRSSRLKDGQRLKRWLGQQLHRHMRVVVFGSLGFEPDAGFLDLLGLAMANDPPRAPITVRRMKKDVVGFEAQPRTLARDLLPWRTRSPEVESWLEMEDAEGRRLDPVVVGPWGAMVQLPMVFRYGRGSSPRWIVDPFTLVRRSLDLPDDLPVPDLTTENGSRLLTTHIDGDGFASKSEFPGSPYAGESLEKRILRRYRVPTTVSIVEAEVGPKGLYPGASPRLERIARSNFSLPHVEIASHSFSHPFSWKGATHGTGEAGHYGRHLPVKGYKFNLEREIKGSVAYINKRLAPAGKRVRVFLWTGDCFPTARALELTRELGLYNVNGGDTNITMADPTLTNVSPLGRELPGGHFQVYAPIINENVYTNLWRGPYWGYQRVIETFKLVDSPRRLKPLSIYYHYYSATKSASVRALEKVYDWALKQRPLPLWISEYAARAQAARRVTLARRLEGGWELRSPSGFPRTVRLTGGAWPDLAASRGVAGVRDLPQGRYVHLRGGDRVVIKTSASAPEGHAHLVRANAPILRWQRRGRRLAFRLRGHVPVEATLGAVAPECVIERGAPAVKRDGARMTLNFSGKDTGETILACPE